MELKKDPLLLSVQCPDEELQHSLQKKQEQFTQALKNLAGPDGQWKIDTLHGDPNIVHVSTQKNAYTEEHEEKSDRQRPHAEEVHVHTHGTSGEKL